MSRPSRPVRRDDSGSAVVDFVLVMLVVVPLFLGIVQVALVLHVRNTAVSAAAEGARYAATFDRGPEDGAARTSAVVADVLSPRFARDVRSAETTVDGLPGVVVEVDLRVPALGIWGPGVDLTVDAHAVEEAPP